nr:hypothetical protein F38B7.5 - Caenorhabditis elegans [Caenorhabditis elegans]
MTKEGKMLTIPLVEENGKRDVMIKLIFTPPHDAFRTWVVNEFNKFIEENKNSMQATQSKRPPSAASGSSSRTEKSSVRPIFNEQILREDHEKARQLSRPSSQATKSSEVASRLSSDQGRESSIGLMDQMVASSDAFDSLKKDRKRSPVDALQTSAPKTMKPKRSEDIKDEKQRDEKPQAETVFSEILEPAQSSKRSESPLLSSDVFLRKLHENRQLVNTGNSCYYNSTMQAVSSCNPLVIRCEQLYRMVRDNIELFDDSMNNDQADIKRKYIVLQNFLKVVICLGWHFNKRNEGKSIELRRYDLLQYRQNVGKINEEFNNDDQQDAHEFLLTLIGAVDDAMGVMSKNVKTIDNVGITLNPARAFKIDVETMYVCQGCSNEELKVDSRNDLGVSVICLIINLKRYELEGQGPPFSMKKKSCRVEPSFKLDVSSLGNFPPVEHPEMFENKEYSTTEPVNSEDSRLAEITTDDAHFNDSRVSGRLLGGADEEMSQCSVIVEDVKKRKELYFNIFSNEKDFDDILDEMGINNGENQKRFHFERHITGPPSKMYQFQLPGATRGITPDGNCFYRAISWWITGVQSHHMIFREAVGKHLKKNELMFKKYCHNEIYEKYVENAMRDGVWATTCEIFAMANMLNVEIITYLGDSGWVPHSPQNNYPPRKGAIYLKNTNMHYEPTTSLRKNSPERSPMKKENTNGSSMHDELDENDYLKSDIHPGTYSLVAVVCHLGDSPNKGHYVAYTKELYKNSSWLRCSDDNIYAVSKNDVSEAIRSSGYLMFYELQ